VNIGPVDAIPAVAVEMEGAVGVRMRIAIGEPHGAPNFIMRVFDVEPGGNTPRHDHVFEHEVFVLAGRGTLVEETGESPLAPGVVAFVPGGAIHQFRADPKEGLRFICVVPRT
jgi:quercetin dioxygenase-like cupin family protein